MGIGTATVSEVSYCCEKTNYGAWCVNDDESECDSSYTSAPTSCDSTSYCKLGTCYDSVEGICMENVPQRVCIDDGGSWTEGSMENVAQCQLGCCVIADQAAFVSLVRCKRLSTLFGVENNYRTDITNEIECIAEAQAQDVGACVYDEDYERTCKFTTRGDCNAGDDVDVISPDVNITSEKTFYEGLLCSAEELATSCARHTGTTCYEGDVYYVDSCGNRENVYSANEDASWNNGRVSEASEICAANDGSNKNCGNCDYLLGSRCAEYEGILGGSSGSSHYCQKTECVDRNGNSRINGEAWCVYDSYDNSVGSRYYREVCDDGVVKVEACADYRNEVCLEGSIETSDGDFGTAACRVNRWQDCVLQTEEDECLDSDNRDCKWMDSVTGMNIGSSAGEGGSSTTYSNPSESTSTNAFNNPTAAVIAPITGQSIFDDEDYEKTSSNREDGICVPSVSPGLEFWEDSSASTICGQASARCVVVYEKDIFGDKDIVSGKECLEDAWAKSANEICTSLGDCGGSVNYNGVYSNDGYKWIKDGKEKFL